MVHKRGIRGWLSDQFWSGKRWLVLGRDRPRCYANYADASAYCRSEKSQDFRVRILGSFLKTTIGRGDGAQSESDEGRLKAVVACYPLRPYCCAVDWPAELLKGNFYPMVWEKSVHPLLSVSSYAVLWRPGALRVKCRELFITEAFSQAMTRFMKESLDLPGLNGTIQLLGRFCEDGDIGDEQATIIFYQVAIGAGVAPELEQVHDPGLPFVRAFPVFIRYHAKRATLTFYDGLLKRIRPGDEPDHIDLRVFDFQPMAVTTKCEQDDEAG
jgi:hypothetical protein